MPEQEVYTVIAKVTPSQYDVLSRNSVSCGLVTNTEDLDRVRENSSIARIIQSAVCQGCETDEYENEWAAADDADIDPYDLAISHWPITVQSEVLKLAEPYINDHVETSAGGVIYTSVDFGTEGARQFLARYPQFRVMFLVEPLEVSTWFRP